MLSTTMAAKRRASAPRVWKYAATPTPSSPMAAAGDHMLIGITSVSLNLASKDRFRASALSG
eukprot:1190330-Prorocentrum_minimum.AAC.6